MTDRVDVSVVIPVYNNAPSLKELTSRLLNALNKIGKTHEILFVNDGSKDRSLMILKEMAIENTAVKVIDLSRNFGQHPAIAAGFEHSAGDIIVLMDADLQDLPENVIDIVKKLQSDNVDIVYTTRQFAGNAQMKFSSMLFHYVFGRIVKSHIPLNIGTFRAFNRSFLEAVLKFKEFNVIYGPLMFYMGYRSSFLSLSLNDRPHGKSSYTFLRRLHLAINSLISYTDVPHKIAMAFGALILICSFIYAILVFAEYFLFGSSLPGGTTLVVLLLCLMLGSMMMTLGVLGTYLFRIYEEVLDRPRYLIQEKVNFHGIEQGQDFSSKRPINE